MKKLLTIVVPIYKVEKYINKCLDSLVVQENLMEVLEVICVNDGTPDNSAVMAKEYEKKYPDTFKVIDKENGGHGSAWNKGLELATGKYLRFLDSDDWLTNLPDFLGRLATVDVDMIFTDLQIVYEDSSIQGKLYTCNNALDVDKVYNTDKYDWRKSRSMYDGHNFTNFHMCTYRTSILKKFCPIFLEKIFYDDEILMVLPLCVSKTFVYFDLVLYNYLKGREGQTVDINVRLKSLGFDVKEKKQMIEFYNSHPIPNTNLDKELRFIIGRKVKFTLKTITLLPPQKGIACLKEFISWLKQNYYIFFKGEYGFVYKMPMTLFYYIYHTKWLLLNLRSINK